MHVSVFIYKHRSMSVDRTKDEDLSQTKPSIDTPLLVIINGEISITPSGKTDSPKLIRRRSSSLDNQLNGKQNIKKTGNNKLAGSYNYLPNY